MNKRANKQAVVVGIVFIALVWFVNTTASNIDWEHVLHLRLIGLGVLSIFLMIFGVAQAKKRRANLDNILKSNVKMTGNGIEEVLVSVAIGLVVVLVMVSGYNKLENHNQADLRAQARYVASHTDINIWVVVTKSKPYRIVPRSTTTSLSWGPRENVSYKMTYLYRGKIIEKIAEKNGSHITLPGFEWLDLSVLDKDSVIFDIHQHENN